MKKLSFNGVNREIKTVLIVIGEYKHYIQICYILKWPAVLCLTFNIMNKNVTELLWFTRHCVILLP